VTFQDDIVAERLRWASEPGLHHNTNEDRIGMVNNAVWVLDGATTPATVSSCCEKDARWYVDRLNAALTAHLEHQQQVDLRHALAAAIGEVQEAHAASCHDPTAGRGPSSTVAIARRDGTWLDVLVLGDSTILLDHGDHVTTITDTRLAFVALELRREIETALANGRGYRDPDHERRRAQLVEAERLSRNRDGGYWIAADQPQAADHALTARHRIGPESPSVSRLLLMSDGVQRAASVLALYDSNDRLFAAAVDEGPEACIRTIRAAEANDLTGRRHPRTNLSDDASLVVWDIDGAPYAVPA
jgi:serine/threonine protein phosphatase PrpC